MIALSQGGSAQQWNTNAPKQTGDDTARQKDVDWGEYDKPASPAHHFMEMLRVVKAHSVKWHCL